VATIIKTTIAVLLQPETETPNKQAAGTMEADFFGGNKNINIIFIFIFLTWCT
jgi:hypothetical protein